MVEFQSIIVDLLDAMPVDDTIRWAEVTIAMHDTNHDTHHHVRIPVHISNSESKSVVEAKQEALEQAGAMLRSLLNEIDGRDLNALRLRQGEREKEQEALHEKNLKTTLAQSLKVTFPH